MCLHVGNWKKLYHKAFRWKVMMYVFLAVTFLFICVLFVFLVVTLNQKGMVIAVRLADFYLSLIHI